MVPEVFAKMEKGFFLSPSDRAWTCYRRNYFSVACHFELHPHIANGTLLLNGRRVQAMGMRLSAAIDAPAGKGVELIQHTPKRDKGPKEAVEIQKVAPSPPAGRGSEHSISPHGVYQVPMNTFQHTGMYSSPYLPLQNVSDASTQSSSSTTSPAQICSPSYPYGPMPASQLPVQGQNIQHTFERVQFKSATANNGKRRASQQYFHLIVELFADTRPDGADTANWIKIAIRVSDKIVVRGRSPNHYKNEGQQTGSGGRSGSTGETSPSYGHSKGSYGGAGRSTGGGSSSSSRGAHGSSAESSSYWGAQHYGIKTSPTHSDISSSSSSTSGPIDAKFPHEAHQLSRGDDDVPMHDYGTYNYQPSLLYDGVPGFTKVESPDSPTELTYGHDARRFAIREDYPTAVPGTEWMTAGSTRFQAVDSSRGYYPTEMHLAYS